MTCQWADRRFFFKGAAKKTPTLARRCRTVATLLDRERSTDHAAAQLGHSDTAVTKAHYIAKAHRAPDVSNVLQQLSRPGTLAAPPAIGM